jgi:hypothetical protein
MNKDFNLTRIHDYIKATLPWAYGLESRRAEDSQAGALALPK